MIQVPLVGDGGAGARAAIARIRTWLAARATTVPFRLAVALGLLGLQLAVAIHSGERFNASSTPRPGTLPTFKIRPATGPLETGIG